MKSQNQKKPDINYFTCKICQQIFIRPVTLSCGHTFCRNCLKKPNKTSNIMLNSDSQNNSINFKELSKKNGHKVDIEMSKSSQNVQEVQAEKQNKKKHNKIPVCDQCSNIIWKPIQQINENITLQSLLQKYFHQQINQRIRNHPELNKKCEIKNQLAQIQGGKYSNKIIIRIEQLNDRIPMPFCFSRIAFSSYFHQQITQQRNQVVIVWKELLQKGIGLLGSIKSLQVTSVTTRILNLLMSKQNMNIPQQTFKAVFLGKCFVKITEIGIIPINIKNKFVIVGANSINKILADLQVCDCIQYHAQNSQNVALSDFDRFFYFYDQLNNPHFMRQINRLITQGPFNNRNNTQHIMYCALRVLRIPNNIRKQMVMSFDDRKRFMFIMNFLEENKNKEINKIMNVTIPGQSSPTLVLIIIFVLLLLNYFQNS